MTIKQRIWLLPAIAILASVLGAAATIWISSSASRTLDSAGNAGAALDYVTTMQASVGAIEETLKYAVAASDKQALTTASAKGEEFRSKNAQLAQLTEHTAMAREVGAQFDKYLEAATNATALLLGVKTGDASAAIQAMQESQLALHKTLAADHVALTGNLATHLVKASSRVRSQVIISLVAGLLVALGLAITSMRLIPSITGPIGHTVQVLAQIEKGNYDSPINVSSADEIGQVLKTLDSMQRGLKERTARERVALLENSRIRTALDRVSVGALLADTEGQIIYMNDACKNLFRERSPELRTALPQFDCERLVGGTLDSFRGIAALDRTTLAQVTGVHSADFRVGNAALRIVANPVTDADNKRVGTVIQWLDRSLELATENEVSELVSRIVAGDLSQRVATEGKAGFFLSLTNGINTIAGAMEGLSADINRLTRAARDGNLSERMPFEGRPGLNQALGARINDLVDEVSSLVGELQKLVDAANAGDLRVRVPVQGKSGLFQRVGGGVNDLVDNMAGLISQVKVAALEVHRGADEITEGNTNLSRRTEAQASSLEQTASSMEEMTSTVKQNADNAGQANMLAVAARDQAEQGGAVVAKAIVAMTGINDASRKIADIIGVIDEIAFQTNLLALNAAVEAARAGEQGRGFAVVATEVRNLAGRSATAAKQIKALIQDSGQKVEEGSLLVSQSGATLGQIVSSVKKVADIVAEIAAASQEQSDGIEQVNKAVMQLDELTQQNSALVEEASAASQSMAEQARSLNETMARYTVQDSGAVQVAGKRGAAAATPPGERRAGSRPWAAAAPGAGSRKRVAAKVPEPVPALPMLSAASGGADAVWKEF